MNEDAVCLWHKADIAIGLVEVQYVTKLTQSERKTLCVITDRGRQALANALQ